MIHRSRPEEQGIAPAVLLHILDELDSKRVPIHSLLIMRHGKLCFEAYWAPWKAESLHRVYSVTKSFTALAIGCLERDGKLALDDKIISYFPEYLPPVVHPFLSSLTIRDMLMMRTCHRMTTYKIGRDKAVSTWRNDWVKSFFDTPPDHAPGALFIYDTSATHVLAALVEKLSGMDFMSYLRAKFMDALEVWEESYILSDPEGNPCGGSGIMMRPIDLLKVMELVHEGGKGLLPEKFLQTALSSLSESEPGLGGAGADERAGYGYFFWRMSHDAAAMYGMGGQYAIAIPEKDMVVVTTADTQPLKEGNEIIRNAVWQVADSISEDAIAYDDKSYEKLEARLSELSVPVLHSASEPLFSGKHRYVFEENDSGFESIIYDFSNEKCTVTLKYKDAEYSFTAASGRLERGDFPVSKSSPYYASAGWLKDGTFSVLVYLWGVEMGTVKIQSSFQPGSVTVLMHLYGEVSFQAFEGVYTGLEQ